MAKTVRATENKPRATKNATRAPSTTRWSVCIIVADVGAADAEDEGRRALLEPRAERPPAMTSSCTARDWLPSAWVVIVTVRRTVAPSSRVNTVERRSIPRVAPDFLK
mmetsp:Transcript_11959/g.39369  ORF Transcript_11959/g.39369 Transcript_11959/m.39369 type:complete len:108 (+) Transcript_11959:469-792(+)